MLIRSIALASTLVISSAAGANDWPQWMGPNRDGRWNEAGIIRSLPPAGPKTLWRVPIRGGFAGPAVVNGRVFVFDFETTGDTTGNPDQRSELSGRERVLCLNAGTGKEIWRHAYDCQYKISYPAGPRCTPT